MERKSVDLEWDGNKGSLWAAPYGDDYLRGWKAWWVENGGPPEDLGYVVGVDRSDQDLFLIMTVGIVTIVQRIYDKGVRSIRLGRTDVGIPPDRYGGLNERIFFAHDVAHVAIGSFRV